MREFKTELCLQHLDDLALCNDLPIDRIEWNAALEVGGLTPSLASTRQAASLTTKGLVVMIRPRVGGFCYDASEILIMREDITHFLCLPIQGLVFGVLTADGEIDPVNEIFVKMCHDAGKEAICHRAIDNTRDYDQAFKTLIEMGFDRVLTSGQAKSADLGWAKLAGAQAKYGQAIEILAGCGVTAENVAEIQRKTHIQQFHSSCKLWHQDPTTLDKVDYRVSQAGSDVRMDPEKAKSFGEVVKSLAG